MTQLLKLYFKAAATGLDSEPSSRGAWPEGAVECRPMPTDERLTVAQAADRLGITEGAVRSRIKRGTLPTERERGTVYVVLGGGLAGGGPAGGPPADHRRTTGL